jgi:hypothetical protein
MLQSLAKTDLVYILLSGGREPGCGLNNQGPRLFVPFPSVWMSPSGLTGSAFQSEKRDQLVIHNLPIMRLASNEFLPLDLNEARFSESGARDH